MPFSKKEYNQYKKWCKATLRSVPNHELYGCEPIFPPSILLSMLPGYITEENWEAAAALRDSIREWCNDHGMEIPEEALLNIPALDPIPIT